MSTVRAFAAISAILTLLSLSFLPVAGFSSSALAHSSRNATCSNHAGSKNTVKCVGVLLNGNTVNIEVSNVRVLTDNELNVLNVEVSNVLNNLTISVSDIQVKVLNVFINKLYIPITICQIKVVEIGLINVNIAKC